MIGNYLRTHLQLVLPSLMELKFLHEFPLEVEQIYVFLNLKKVQLRHRGCLHHQKQMILIIHPTLEHTRTTARPQAQTQRNISGQKEDKEKKC